MTSSLSIPQELIHSALEYLSEDIESLSQCALVGQSWLYPAQSCIFRTISLGVGLQDGLALGLVDVPPLGPTINLYPLFHNLLVDSPHLACHIRTLHLGLRPLQSEISASIAALSADDWAKIEECIVDFLPLLCGKGLESLGLFPCGPGIHVFQLQPRICTMLQALFPNSLSLCNWKFADCSALILLQNSSSKSLKFVDCEFIPPPTQFPAPTAYNLDTVTLDHCQGLLVFSKHWVPAQQPYTQYMVVAINAAYISETARIISNSLSEIARSVHRCLTISFGHICADSPVLFSLSPFSHLEILHLVFADNNNTWSGQISMAWLEIAFEVISLQNRLTLHLTIATIFSRQAEWESRLHSQLHNNPTVHIREHSSQPNGFDGRIVSYVLRSPTQFP
ncbi:hypothetical protein K438DRAFT_1935617 [Mycena galopus ATCC 62051]|nr:hypothetical protein K438DRAFT_1935617 [Mycena galopus ATCC 62051]